MLGFDHHSLKLGLFNPNSYLVFWVCAGIWVCAESCDVGLKLPLWKCVGFLCILWLFLLMLVLHLNIHLWSEFMLAALSVVLESLTNRCV
jgi:hypothetical protein